jgi:hypothetical protein
MVIVGIITAGTARVGDRSTYIAVARREQSVVAASSSLTTSGDPESCRHWSASSPQTSSHLTCRQATAHLAEHERLKVDR